MLKDKYKFKLNSLEVDLLIPAIDRIYTNYSEIKDLELQLPLTVLEDFTKRLAGAMKFPKENTAIFLKRSEALAFMVLYKSNMIETNLTTRQIAHKIDSTI